MLLFCRFAIVFVSIAGNVLWNVLSCCRFAIVSVSIAGKVLCILEDKQQYGDWYCGSGVIRIVQVFQSRLYKVEITGAAASYKDSVSNLSSYPFTMGIFFVSSNIKNGNVLCIIAISPSYPSTMGTFFVSLRCMLDMFGMLMNCAFTYFPTQNYKIKYGINKIKKYKDEKRNKNDDDDPYALPLIRVYCNSSNNKSVKLVHHPFANHTHCNRHPSFRCPQNPPQIGRQAQPPRIQEQ